MSQIEVTNNQPAKAFEPEPHRWVERYANQLYSYAFNRLDHEEQARDLVQETFLAALERLSQFQGNSSERTWLTAILKYKIIDIYRKQNPVSEHKGSTKSRRWNSLNKRAVTGKSNIVPGQ